ncbi:MAG: cellulase family glycosylhydrolase [Bradymonadaceae bacterium]
MNRDTSDRVPPVECGDAKLEVESDSGRLLDARGRRVVMRGINTGGRSKWRPFLPFPVPASPSPEEVERRARPFFERVVEWGLDTVRLPFSWEALEPVRGEYDEAYRRRYRAMVDAAWSLGLRVIVDFHQDVFAAPFCGDGFPHWAVRQDRRAPARRDHQGWFTQYVFDRDVREAFERFWNDEDGLREAFVRMWTSMAEAFGDHPGVVGFEPMNEPGWGETWDVERWKRETLAPFYEEIHSVLRRAAPDALVFYTPPGIDALYPREAYDPPPPGEGAVFAPHIYDDGLVRGGGWSRRPPEPALADFAEFRSTHGTPVLLGEFGVQHGAEGGTEWLRRVADALDQHRLSATLWEYSDSHEQWNDEDLNVIDRNGQMRPALEAYARPWLRAVAGDHDDFQWLPDRSLARAEWLSTGGVSEIRIPDRLGPPRNVEVAGRGTRHTWDAERGELRIYAPDDALVDVEFSLDPNRSRGDDRDWAAKAQ